MQSLLIIIELFVSIALIAVILLQRSEGGALGMGGGGGGGLGGLFSPRGAADTLTRTTSILAIVFFLTCLALNLLSLRGKDEKSILDTSSPVSTLNAPLPKPAAPAKAPAPAVPTPH
jgi:preprotein translocase subunit SecG